MPFRFCELCRPNNVIMLTQTTILYRPIGLVGLVVDCGTNDAISVYNTIFISVVMRLQTF